MVLLVIFVFVPSDCCDVYIYFIIVASQLFYVWLYICIYVRMCILYHSGKEERP